MSELEVWTFIVYPSTYLHRVLSDCVHDGFKTNWVQTAVEGERVGVSLQEGGQEVTHKPVHVWGMNEENVDKRFVSINCA